MSETPGERFLAALEQEAELGPDARAAAESIAAHLDTIADLEALIEKDGYMTRGSRAQPRLHPAVAELRQARLALSTMLKALGLEDGEQPRTSQAGAALARKRWGS